jgi:hypothetical protein
MEVLKVFLSFRHRFFTEHPCNRRSVHFFFSSERKEMNHCFTVTIPFIFRLRMDLQNYFAKIVWIKNFRIFLSCLLYMRTVFKFIFLLTFSLISNISFGQTNHDFLHRIVDTTNGEYGDANSKGDTVIQLDKYLICYTAKFYNLAIVAMRDKGVVGIDRKENILFNVYIFDNGPDYPSNGLFRMVKSVTLTTLGI